ncbi:hypothetical protein AGMMS50267_17740 [Spirochaetia bacterium]|nr:hypothetical protein AGMMS50267_17740 [Spirochaetia bacterium]
MSPVTVSPQLFLLLFAAVAVFHLIVLTLGRERLRRISKVLLVPLLLGYYVAAAEHFLFVVVLAGLLGWVGDILLLKHDKHRRLLLGLAGFLLGHLGYINALWHFTGEVDAIPLIIAIALIIPLGVFGIRRIRPIRAMRLPVCLYAAALGAMCISAFCLMRYRGDSPGTMIFAGSLCFAASDTTLAYFLFRKLPRLANLVVMATYIAAQAGLIIGLAGL